jgi:hypothetical protein
VKLLDFTIREAELESSDNPFALIVLAHLKARETQRDPANRAVWKLRLVRGLYERGFSAKDVRELFRLVDWLMVLPPPLETAFEDDFERFQKERSMPYVTSIERVKIARGFRKGIKAVLGARFGDEGLKLMPEIEAIYEEKELESILDALETAASPAEVRKLWTTRRRPRSSAVSPAHPAALNGKIAHVSSLPR